MPYDPRDHTLTARDTTASILVCFLALAILAALGRDRPNHEAGYQRARSNPHVVGRFEYTRGRTASHLSVVSAQDCRG